MKKLQFERRVPYSPDQMMKLVGDLESYPNFVPNCSGMDVQQGFESDQRLARMGVQFGPINQAYTSRVTMDKTRGTVSAHAIDGPFTHLDSIWRFVPDGEGTSVYFDIEFGFSNPLIATVAEPVFTAKQEEIMDAFMAEAARRYG